MTVTDGIFICRQLNGRDTTQGVQQDCTLDFNGPTWWSDLRPNATAKTFDMKKTLTEIFALLVGC